MWAWIAPILKRIAIAKLGQTGKPGQIGSSFLENAWFGQNQKQNQPPMNFERRINPITGEIQTNPWYQQKQNETFWDVFFKALMSRR